MVCWNMKKYVTQSLEMHLFFGRIMKEHALFLQAGFPAEQIKYRKRAEWFREQFEKSLMRAVQLSDGIVGEELLNSGEIVTGFTKRAEKQTSALAGIPIDIRITEEENKLRAGCLFSPDRELVQQVRRLNERILWLLNGLIEFKEMILREVTGCRLYTANYPLLIEHILREARLYRSIVIEIGRRGYLQTENLKKMEIFWNQIMMEHALFIRGLLDPSECELIETADDFAGEFGRLLEKAKEQDLRTLDELTRKTLEQTEKYRDFKAAGTEGIINCKVRSVILPLLGLSLIHI